MKPPTPGLRPLHNGSKHVAKVDLRVQPGDTIEVSEDVALQLLVANPEFKDGVAPPPPVVEAEPVADVKPAPRPVAAAKKGPGSVK